VGAEDPWLALPENINCSKYQKPEGAYASGSFFLYLKIWFSAWILCAGSAPYKNDSIF